MKKEFLISVLTKQLIEGEKEELEVMTKAFLEFNENGYVINYTEEEEDKSKSETTLKVEKGRITVSREGVISTHMVIEEGVRSLSHHVTPYGAFSMGVTAVKVESDISENGGALRFKYMTDVENAPLGEIEFDITLNPIG